MEYDPFIFPASEYIFFFTILYPFCNSVSWPSRCALILASFFRGEIVYNYVYCYNYIYLNFFSHITLYFLYVILSGFFNRGVHCFVIGKFWLSHILAMLHSWHMMKLNRNCKNIVISRAGNKIRIFCLFLLLTKKMNSSVFSFYLIQFLYFYSIQFNLNY